MMADYLTDEEKAELKARAKIGINLYRGDTILKLLQELEDLKAELFNGLAERFRESDVRAHRQDRIIAVAKEALRTIAEIEGDK